MGLFGALMGEAANVAKENAEKAAELKWKKAGKTLEQQRCLDFFYTLGENSGCLSKGSSNFYSMSEYQKLVSEKCATLQLKEKALNKIGLDISEISEINPVVLSSYRFTDDSLIKVTNDTAVSNLFSVTWIFFSDKQLYTYTFIFDTTSDDTWEFTKEYFYTDITCINTAKTVKEQIDRTSQIKGCLNKKEHIDAKKSIYVVDELEITVPGSSYSFSMRNSDSLERSIQGVKAMIRDKKYRR